ncbi:MAG: RadC family protein [Ruminiclostridium sp.]|nr:RadC family protein [Ruminiclostridium sp.]
MAEKGKNVHEGHRKRMREQFLELGLESFNEHQILEFALFYGIPRNNTNVIAHALLNEFGGRLCDVIEAPRRRLMNIRGISENSATYIMFLREFSSYYIKNRQLDPDEQFTDEIKDVCAYFEALFAGVEREEVHAAAITPKYRLLCERKLAEGDITSVGFPRRKLMDFVSECGCDKVIIAHNHPHGFAVASKDDFYVTRELVHDFRKFDIEIADHIIVSEGGSQSMRTSHYAGSIWTEEL